MDDLDILARDFGFMTHGKSASMRSGSGDPRLRSSSSFIGDHNRNGMLFDDVFGGPPKPGASNHIRPSSMSDYDYDSIFKGAGRSDPKSKLTSAVPVYDKPTYDDDIFDGLPGLKSKSISTTAAMFEDDAFDSRASQPRKQGDQFDDLLGNFGENQKVELQKKSSFSRGLDDLLPGFGSGNSANKNRTNPDSSEPLKPTSSVMDDPSVVLGSASTPRVSSFGLFTDPLEDISNLSQPSNTKADVSSVSEGTFDDIDPLNGFGKYVPAFSFGANNRKKEAGKSSSFRYHDNLSQKKIHVDDFEDSHQTMFNMPATSAGFVQNPFSQPASEPFQTTSRVDSSPEFEECEEPSNDVWLTVSEIPLNTLPTSAPPPSRPPPPIPWEASKMGRGSFSTRKKGLSSSSSNRYSQTSRHVHPASESHVVSPIDELEDFAMGKAPNSVDGNADTHSGEDIYVNSAAAASAAAMKEAMDRAEAKFRHAKEVRERESAKAARTKESVHHEKDEQSVQEENRDRLEREWQRREREEREREERRLEKERERAREIEKEKARQAVERATREARERAAAEARLKAERIAVQRAQAEARERAAIEARIRAEKAAAEARARANAEAREKAERDIAAVARAEAEARRRGERAAVERATAEARERAAATARMNQQKNENDLDSFFSMGSRPSSAPRARENSSDSSLDPLFQKKGGPESAKRTSSSGTSSNARNPSSAVNIVDDLSSIFGAAPSSGGFQEIEGETEERRRARVERHQRTQERAAKALAEKNQRDLQTQRDQEERHRIAGTLDIEIKRWAAGKEGNLRALLSTLQNVLWPECGWQPVPLTDLITGASVKKVYRKATLCIHPDKVQQKGANLQQKYVAEKVFDLLKEAWNKFNSEELF